MQWIWIKIQNWPFKKCMLRCHLQYKCVFSGLIDVIITRRICWVIWYFGYKTYPIWCLVARCLCGVRTSAVILVTRTVNIRAPSQYAKRRLFVRSCKVSKPRDLYLELSDRSEIWQALRQHCCRCACQISKRYDNLKYQSRGFETSRDLTKRRLFGYWDGALVPCSCQCYSYL